MNYQVPTHINPNTIFIIKRSELEGRLEPEYYKPSIRTIENKIRSKANKKLKDFAIKLASGATPLVAELEKFYSNQNDGIPFLRVQNLQTNGKLYLEDLKYINRNTHSSYLKRSQVSQDDLLVKITGVGKMAIASVPPKQFEGNTNQHLVVIKTENRDTSEYLANYLNLDIIEKLATRRATGGTRPALDYTSLKSIPIVENIDFTILERAELEKTNKEAEAQKLLESIDTYLLQELGVALPPKNVRIESRMFKVSFSEVTGSRLDPDYLSKYKYLINQKANYKFEKLGSLLTKSPQYGANEEALDPLTDDDTRYIRITDIDENGMLKKDKWKTAKNTIDNYLLKENDILIARSGSVGKCYIHKAIEKPAIFAGYLIRFKINENKALPDYIFNYCNSSIYKFWVSAIERPAVQSNINSEEFKSLPIPLPSIPKQKEINDYIANIHQQITQLKAEAQSILENAKAEVEKMILG